MSIMDIDLDAVDTTAPALQPQGGERPCTEKQVRFISALVKDRDTSAVSGDVDRAREAVMAGRLGRGEASELIDLLKSQPWKPREQTPQREVGEGFYRTEDGHTFKVVTSRTSGHLYAKRLYLEEPDCGGCANGEMCEPEPCRWTARWEYDPSGMRRVRATGEELTAEQAREFGDLTSQCIYCGRRLTDERSIAAGYGPTCADHRGLPWGAVE